MWKVKIDKINIEHPFSRCTLKRFFFFTLHSFDEKFVEFEVTEAF